MPHRMVLSEPKAIVDRIDAQTHRCTARAGGLSVSDQTVRFVYARVRSAIAEQEQRKGEVESPSSEQAYSATSRHNGGSNKCMQSALSTSDRVSQDLSTATTRQAPTDDLHSAQIWKYHLQAAGPVFAPV
jgi:hypothetical protein